MLKSFLYIGIAVTLLLQSFEKHESPNKTLLWTIDWSADDSQIAAGGDDSLIRIFDGKNLKLLQSFKINGMIRQLRWHPATPVLAIATSTEVSILDPKTKKTIPLKGITDGARAVGWNYNGQLLATADNDGLVKIWNAKGKLLKAIPKEDKNSYFSLDWHPQKNILAVSGDDIRIIDTSAATLRKIRHREEKTGVLAVRWHPSGRFYATGDYGHDDVPSLLQFWDADGKLLKALQDSKAEYRNIQWNKDGSYLATASDALRIWNEKGELQHTATSDELLWGIDWNSKSTQIVTASINGNIQLWSAQAKAIQEIKE